MDKSLWKEIIETVKPLKRRDGAKVDVVKIIPLKKSNDNDIEFSFLSLEDIKPLKKKKLLYEKELYLGDVSRIDNSVLKNIKRRKFDLDASLDLHGKTLDVAFVQFVNFINSSYDNGKRNVLVITGKGNPEKNTGVIKQNFYSWLNHESVSDKILYVNFALLKDGGDGAFYILLRKK